MKSKLYRYAIIGTGRPGGTEGATGFGMAHHHYRCFNATGRVELVAICDIKDDPAQFFLKKYESDAKHYHDYHKMLKEEKPDIVSICVWPHLHSEMAVAAAEAGVKAIHCEKPMATTWGDCKRMKAAADASGSKLTFGHQRRYIYMFQKLREELQSGVIGDLVMIEAQVGDMFDWGTHWLDMMQFYNNETPIEWVIGQLESHTEKRIFGAYMENQAICHFKWTNGVRGLLVVGEDAKIGSTHRIIGTKGVVETLSERKYRILGNGESEWKEVEVPQGEKGDLERSMEDVVRQLDEPEHKTLIGAEYAIQHTEAIFATYYSSMIRGRITFPLLYDGNALMDMLENGDIGPNRKK